jgi:hypothetical protein
MVLLPPFCPLAGLNALRIAGLRATVLLLLTLLIKAKIRIQAFSALGILLLLLQTLVSLAAAGGVVTAAAGAAWFYGRQRR